MVKILKYFIVIMFWTIIVQSCKSTHTTQTKRHFVSDTLIRTETKSIQLPVNYTYLSSALCKDNSLIVADQSIEIGNLKIRIKQLNGKLAIEVEKHADTATSIIEKESHTEIIDEKIDTLQIRYKLYNWAWWLLAYAVLATVYIFRKIIPILKLIPF